MGGKAVVYCRVSSVDQVKNGHGLSSQEARCREFAKFRELEVSSVFHEEGVSGSLIDRPAMRRMLAFLREHRQGQIVVLIDDISRLARDLRAHLKLRMAIQSAGGILQSPSIEFGHDSDSQLVENLLASVSQHQRQKNTEQVKHRMRARLLNGYWFFPPPRGYRLERRSGHGKMLVRQEPLASIVQEGLEGFASGRFGSQAELQRFFESRVDFPKDRKGRVHFERVAEILRCKVYSGYYDYPKWDVGLTKGKHEPLISFETAKKIQERLASRSKTPHRQDINADFPLRGFVLCESCESPMTACWSQGRNDRYPYYLCRSENCVFTRKSLHRNLLEGDFEQLLKSLTPTAGVIDMLLDMLLDVNRRNGEEAEKRVEALRNEKKQIDQKMEQFLDRIVTAGSPILLSTYERHVKELEERRIVLDEKIHATGMSDGKFDASFQTAFQLLGKPLECWVSSDIAGKRTLLKATFTRPVVYRRKDGFQTAPLSLPFSVVREFSTGNFGVVEATGVYSNRLRDFCDAIRNLSQLMAE